MGIFDSIKNDQEDNFQGGSEIGIIGKGNARKYMNRLAVGNANDAGIDYRVSVYVGPRDTCLV